MLNVTIRRRSMMASLALAWGAVGAAGQAQQAAPAVTTPVPGTANVTIDFARSSGATRHVERYSNLTDFDLYTKVRPDDVRFYNEQGLHGSIYRVWLANKLYDPATKRYDVVAMSPYLTDASAISDSVMLNVMPSNLIEAGMSPAQIKPIIKDLIRDLKQRFPRLDYIEAFNEPDHTLSATMRPEQLYPYYVPFYEAVNEVNRELKPKTPLRLGGPALFMFNQPWIKAFLDGYKADRAPAKKLDFLSYHAYGYFHMSPGTTKMTKPPVFFKTDPSEVAKHRPIIDEELRVRGLNPRLPSYITELGLYPGPSFDNLTDPRPDYLRQAAGVASLLYWMQESADNVPFNWILRHQTEERKDQLITRVGKDKPAPTNVFSPYGNAMLMMSKLKAVRVSARSDAIVDGKGVYAIATRDRTGAAVLVWNYQHVANQAMTARIAMNALPADLRGKRLRTYRVDATTSNYWADPTQANLKMVADTVVQVRGEYTMTVPLGPNALELIVLEPAT